MFRMLFVFVVMVVGGSLFVLLSCYYWQGAFEQIEYRLTFQTRDASPVAGVELVVENDIGKRSYFYPVTDYDADHGLRSDTDGRIVFHHVTSHFPEFGGRCCECPIPLGICSTPVFYCTFLHQGQVVYRVNFRDLQKEWQDNTSQRKVISIDWQWPKNRSGDFPNHLRPEHAPKKEKIEFEIFEKKIAIEK